MTRIVRNRLFLALALGVAATAPRSSFLRSFPNRDVACQRFFNRATPNNDVASSTFAFRLQETGLETRLNASVNAPPFEGCFWGEASNAALSPGCPNGVCPSAPPSPTFPPADLPPAPAGILRSVVRVYNAYEETISTSDGALGPTRRRVVEKGSGAFVANSVGERYVLTAAHIFRDGRGQIAAQSLDGRIFAASLVLASNECDVALLRIDAPCDAPALTISSSWPRQGETVWRAGFGPNETLQELAGVVKGYVKTDRYATYETLKIDGSARQGDSGGPVYNASGEIVGVLWGTDGTDAYATYCGRVLKTLCDFSPTFAPDAVQAETNVAAPSSPNGETATDVDALNNGIPSTYVQGEDDATPAPPSKLRDLGNAALAFTVLFAFGFCGFFATKPR